MSPADYTLQPAIVQKTSLHSNLASYLLSQQQASGAKSRLTLHPTIVFREIGKGVCIAGARRACDSQPKRRGIKPESSFARQNPL